MYTESYKSARRKFRVFFILVPLVAAGIIALIWSAKRKYMAITSPVYITMEQLEDTVFSGPMYVILQDVCAMDEYVYFSEGSSSTSTTYYYFFASCDSTRTDSPVIIAEMSEERQKLMESENITDYVAVMEIFEGALENGYTAPSSHKDYMYSHMGLHNTKIYTFYSGKTPHGVRKNLELGTNVVLVITLVILIALFVFRYFSLRNAKEEDMRMDFILQNQKKI